MAPGGSVRSREGCCLCQTQKGKLLPPPLWAPWRACGLLSPTATATHSHNHLPITVRPWRGETVLGPLGSQYQHHACK